MYGFSKGDSRRGVKMVSLFLNPQKYLTSLQDVLELNCRKPVARSRGNAKSGRTVGS